MEKIVEKVIPKELLDDLCSRFIINIPEEEQNDLIRILFQIENAHWFYIDFYSKEFPGTKPCGFREFSRQIFQHIPYLQPFVNQIDVIIEDWKGYKVCVPTFGAILLDEELSHVLLVKSFRSAWGFPKGKVNKSEPPYHCAIREVCEETGFDISQLIDQNDYIETIVNNQKVRLYIIPGVTKSTKFCPKTRNEIKEIKWFPICDIPLNRKDAAQRQLRMGHSGSVNFNAFYMVSPFLRKLRQWIYDNNSKLPQRKKRPRHRSCSDIDVSFFIEPVEFNDTETDEVSHSEVRSVQKKSALFDPELIGMSLIKCLVQSEKEKGIKLPSLPRVIYNSKPLEVLQKSVITELHQSSLTKYHKETKDEAGGKALCLLKNHSQPILEESSQRNIFSGQSSYPFNTLSQPPPLLGLDILSNDQSATNITTKQNRKKRGKKNSTKNQKYEILQGTNEQISDKQLQQTLLKQVPFKIMTKKDLVDQKNNSSPDSNTEMADRSLIKRPTNIVKDNLISENSLSQYKSDHTIKHIGFGVKDHNCQILSTKATPVKSGTNSKHSPIFQQSGLPLDSAFHRVIKKNDSATTQDNKKDGRFNKQNNGKEQLNSRSIDVKRNHFSVPPNLFLSSRNVTTSSKPDTCQDKSQTKNVFEGIQAAENVFKDIPGYDVPFKGVPTFPTFKFNVNSIVQKMSEAVIYPYEGKMNEL